MAVSREEKWYPTILRVICLKSYGFAKNFCFLELLLTYFLDCLLQCFNKLGVRDSHLRLINDELVLDEVLKSNEATGKTVEAAEATAAGGNCGGECGAPPASAAQAASAGETALAEITPPEQFQNFYAFPPEQPQSAAATSTGGSNKKPFSRSASVGNQVIFYFTFSSICV